jgi:hypothetical protein
MLNIRQSVLYEIWDSEVRRKSANHLPVTPVPALVPATSRRHLGEISTCCGTSRIRPASGYNTDEAPNNMGITVELFAQVRNNGRILDGTRHVLGGQDFEAVFKLSKLSSDEEMREWTVHTAHVSSYPQHHPTAGHAIQCITFWV